MRPPARLNLSVGAAAAARSAAIRFGTVGRWRPSRICPAVQVCVLRPRVSGSASRDPRRGASAGACCCADASDHHVQQRCACGNQRVPCRMLQKQRHVSRRLLLDAASQRSRGLPSSLFHRHAHIHSSFRSSCRLPCLQLPAPIQPLWSLPRSRRCSTPCVRLPHRCWLPLPRRSRLIHCPLTRCVLTGTSSACCCIRVRLGCVR
jgi:hypothetical protein